MFFVLSLLGLWLEQMKMYLSTEVSDKSVLLDGLVNGGAATFFHVAQEYCPTVLQMVRVQDPESLFYIARKWYPSCVCAVVSTNQIESIPDTEMERWNQLLPQDKLAFSDQWAFVSNETRKIRVDSVTYAWLQIGGLILQTASPATLDDTRFRHKRGAKTDLILSVRQDEKLKGNAATFPLLHVHVFLDTLTLTGGVTGTRLHTRIIGHTQNHEKKQKKDTAYY